MELDLESFQGLSEIGEVWEGLLSVRGLRAQFGWIFLGD